MKQRKYEADEYWTIARKALKLKNAGYDIPDIAERFGVTSREMYRMLGDARKELTLGTSGSAISNIAPNSSHRVQSIQSAGLPVESSED